LIEEKSFGLIRHPGMKVLAIFCLLAMGAGLFFSQRAREMIVGLSGSPAVRQHFAGRKLLLANLAAASAAKFDDYDGHTNTAVQIRADAWLAGGFVEYHWRGANRRERWFCAFDALTRDVLTIELGPISEATPEFQQQLERLRGEPKKTVVPSAENSIKQGWGWEPRR
jgi:hypothetical protein